MGMAWHGLLCRSVHHGSTCDWMCYAKFTLFPFGFTSSAILSTLPPQSQQRVQARLLTCLSLPSTLPSFACAWSYIMLARRGMSIMAVGLTALTSSKKVDMSLHGELLT